LASPVLSPIATAEIRTTDPSSPAISPIFVYPFTITMPF